VPQKDSHGSRRVTHPYRLGVRESSFWERIYLLWTFRNFQSLPKQVLESPPADLIDRLCRAAIVTRMTIARTSSIGAVENVYLMPDRKRKLQHPQAGRGVGQRADIARYERWFRRDLDPIESCGV